MDVSGGSGQPRSGNDRPAEHSADPTAPATEHPGPPLREASDRAADAQAPAPDAGTSPSAATSDVPGPPAPSETETHEAAKAYDAAKPHDAHDPVDARDEADRPAEHDDNAPHRPDAGEAADADRATASDVDGEPEPAEDAPAAPVPPAATSPAPRTHPEPPPAPDAHPDRSHADSGIAKGRPPQRPREPGGGLLMGRPFGVPVYVAPSWFLVAALITWVFGGQLDRVLPELGAARYLVSLFFAVAFYASVLVHELAHTVAAIRYKLPVRRIQLQFFGGVSEIEKEAETPGREFVLAFVGPLLSLVLAGIFYLAMQPVRPGTVPGVLLAGLMISNLIVAAFNLLPGLPLDGGRMLRAVVWKITGKPMSGTVAAAWVGRALAISVLIGLPLLNQSGTFGSGHEEISGMDTVTDALLAAILAAIIWTGAGNSLRMARLREHLPELRARNLTRRAVPVETDTPLSEALRRANAAGARALVVVDADGNPLSLVREAAIVGVPEHRRPWVAVSGLAQDLTDGMRVSAELAGEDLLDALRATPATEYLVVEETGEIYGVLSAADVERAFVKAMARPA
ncbi:site-2 protease family protein [Streptomyces sp. NPDC005209]|uniref:site-2 protease family protein n=1 Tax=Streptomyces sp. NPDC005209 TaxID=3156715 RepID=UPI0033A64908